MVAQVIHTAGSTPLWPTRAERHNWAMDDLTQGVEGIGRFLTLTDVAEILNISASQSYALVRSGELPAIKVGGHGHWRIERDVLEKYIEAKYEETRRLSLWNQSEFTLLPEYNFSALAAERSASQTHNRSRST